MARTWFIAAALSLALANTTVVSAQQAAAPPDGAAQAGKPAETSRLREEQRAYFGRNVRVHRTDGTTTTGRLIGETSVGLAIQPTPSDEPVLVPYEEVESIAVGMRRWQKIALGLGAAAAVVLGVALN